MAAPKKLYSGIDLFKLLASLLVVLIHATETSDRIACEIVFVFTRFAVPFFFISSGFFFFKGLEYADNPKEYFIKFEKNIALLYVVWALIIDLPSTIISYMKIYAGENLFKLILVLIRRLFVAGSGPYWYLLALLFATPVIYFFYTKRKHLALVVIIFFCLGIEILYSCFRGICSHFFAFDLIFKVFDFAYSWELNFFMYGIPFMGIGFIIAKSDFFLSPLVSAVVFIISTGLRVIEYGLPLIFPGDFWFANTISIAFIFQAIAFFLFAKEIVLPIKPHTSLLFRQLSSFIYFSHEIFMYVILDSILRSNAEYLIYEPWFILPKMVLSLIPCVLLFIIIKKINNKHLNILING